MSRTSAGRFVKGASGNPSGVRKAKRAAGSDGVVAYGGFLQTGERDAALIGSQKWVTYDNAYTRPAVAIALLLRNALLRGVKWTLRENVAGGKAAKRGVDICQQGLLDARLPRPWNAIVPKAGMHYFNGSSLHAFALGRRKDGLVVFTDLAHRPMHTVYRWLRADDTQPWEAFEQQTKDNKSFVVPLSECLYLVNDMVGDSPEGVGVLRFVVERIRRLSKYEALEGSEMFSSMGGTPIARVPLEDINASVPAGASEAEAAAHKRTKTSSIEDIVSMRIKTPEKTQYAVLDSATYQGTDPNTISTVPKWNIEILKGDLQGLPEIRKVITDEDLNIARMLGVEGFFIGGGDTKGTFSASESKFNVFAGNTQTTVDEIAVAARDQLLRVLVAANGLDPDDATPDLVPEPLTPKAVLEAAQLLEAESRAGAHPEDEAWDVLRERAELPPRPKEALLASMMAPRAPVPVEGNPENDPETVAAPDEKQPEEP